MAIPVEMAQYLDLFVQEAEEGVQTLERELLFLEKEPTPERIDLVFRAAHTLKGASRAMGFERLSEVTHEMENALDAVRRGETSVSTPLADALLSCLDALRTMVDAVKTTQEDSWDDDGSVGRLSALLDENGPTAPVDPDGLSPELAERLERARAERPVYRAKLVLRDDCVMKFVRAFMAIQTVGDSGELLASVPDAETLEEETFGNDFALYFHSNEPVETLEKRLKGVGEMASVVVAAYGVPVPSPIPRPAARVQAPVEESPVEAAPRSAPAIKPREASSTVRVDVARLDDLMNLVGELVIDRARLSGIGAALAAKYTLDEHLEAFAETCGHLARIASDLQDGLMKTRMMPIETVFDRFPRMVRDLAASLGKEANLEVSGGETELDRSVLECIGDPLIHILRNAIDHGLETPDERGEKPRQGTVSLHARHEENHIVIEIADDGRGIDADRLKAKALAQGLIAPEAAARMSDREALNLIFRSGLSTADQVSELSGRGVGMDIVRANLQKFGGMIEVESALGGGTRFTLRLPLTLAIIRGLLVRVAGVVYVLPLASVVEALRIEPSQVHTLHGSEVLSVRGETVPLVPLRRVFGRASEKASEAEYVVVVGLADRRLGLVVDRLVGEQEVVIKSLNRFCGEVRGVSGATILGDGSVALIVDVNGIVAEATA